MIRNYGKTMDFCKIGLKYSLQTEAEEEVLNKKRSKKAEAKYKERQRFAKVEPALEEQFATGRVLGINVFILKFIFFGVNKLYFHQLISLKRPF